MAQKRTEIFVTFSSSYFEVCNRWCRVICIWQNSKVLNNDGIHYGIYSTLGFDT